jgi:hypothetical protein
MDDIEKLIDSIKNSFESKVGMSMESFLKELLKFEGDLCLDQKTKIIA